MIDRLGDESSETDAAIVSVETQGNHVLKLNSGDFSLYHQTPGFAQLMCSIQVYLYSAFHDKKSLQSSFTIFF